MIKRHTKKNQAHPQGAIVEREGTVHLSNLMLAEKFDARAAARAGQTAKQEKPAAEAPAAPAEEAKA
jgi:large subunit ribosomal protein L24